MPISHPPIATAPPPRELSAEEAELLAADAIGDVIEHWGFRKPLGRLWTVLYLVGGASSASELGERLSMSSGAVSMALTELQRWGIVKRVWRPGTRKEFYEAETDFWKMISRVVNERERFLLASVHDRLELAAKSLRSGAKTAEDKERVARVEHLVAFTSVAEGLVETFVASRRADFSSFGNLRLLANGATTTRRR
jgi:HTH-type transcriptional regulator, glycine betaine synthesis regulator